MKELDIVFKKKYWKPYKMRENVYRNWIIDVMVDPYESLDIYALWIELKFRWVLEWPESKLFVFWPNTQHILYNKNT